MGVKHKAMDLEQRRGAANRVGQNQRRVGIDWSDPKEVAAEIGRIDSHIRSANERVAILERELEAGRKAHAAWPAREAFIVGELPAVRKRVEQLTEKKVDVLLAMGGARKCAELAKVERRVKALKAEIAAERSGKPKVKPKSTDRAPKPGEYASGLGDPSVGDVYSPK